MIRHLSIDAYDPLRVARVLAEIWNGKAYKFFYPGSYTVMPFDDNGTAVVVFPQGTVWAPSPDTQAAQLFLSESTDLVAVHAAVSVPATQQQLEQIGEREGWRVLTRNQGDGAFRLVEFWLENRILFEFLPPGYELQYVQTMQPAVIERMLGQPVYPDCEHCYCNEWDRSNPDSAQSSAVSSSQSAPAGAPASWSSD